ncbi:hypothetical protein R5R35_014239 [Gryllus longicercus]|uniref:Uncharacterized protein n=1 Tax=Gryllus longicercus TaxID=2509291 RepID=A0AAN9VBC3_9ORTH
MFSGMYPYTLGTQAAHQYITEYPIPCTHKMDRTITLQFQVTTHLRHLFPLGMFSGMYPYTLGTQAAHQYITEYPIPCTHKMDRTITLQFQVTTHLRHLFPLGMFSGMYPYTLGTQAAHQYITEYPIPCTHKMDRTITLQFQVTTHLRHLFPLGMFSGMYPYTLGTQAAHQYITEYPIPCTHKMDCTITLQFQVTTHLRHLFPLGMFSGMYPYTLGTSCTSIHNRISNPLYT